MTDLLDALSCAQEIVRRFWQELLRDRFRYVMVDEHQDTNHIQYQMIRLLAEEHQSSGASSETTTSSYIRVARADIRNMLDFEEERFSAAKVAIKLEQNYRSCGNILTAGTFRQYNRGRKTEKAVDRQR